MPTPARPESPLELSSSEPDVCTIGADALTVAESVPHGQSEAEPNPVSNVVPDVPGSLASWDQNRERKTGGANVIWKHGGRNWSISSTTKGMGADCRCHSNWLDVLGTTTWCKKKLPQRKVQPESEAELRRLAKVWLLCGLDISDGEELSRSFHVAIDPRSRYVGVSEAELDTILEGLG